MSKPGSVENIFKEVAKPKYTFPEKEIPKGSATFQLVVTDCEGEIRDKGSDSNDDDYRKPSKEYMGRRRNTLAIGEINSSSGRRKSVHFDFDMGRSRKGSLMPDMHAFRSRSPSPNMLNVVLDRTEKRSRSISPQQRNSIQANDLAFGSTKERKCLIR